MFVVDLSQAVTSMSDTPYGDTPYGAQLVIKVFAAALAQHEVYGSCAICDCWTSFGACVGALVPEIFDPESPQLGVRRQVIEVLDEISEDYHGCVYADIHSRYKDVTRRPSGEVLLEQGTGYTKVTRGIKWLVESALWDTGGFRPTRYGPPTKALETILAPQPIYDGSKDYKVMVGPDQAEIFSLSGVMAPAIRIFTKGPHGDEAAIEHIVEFFMREALSVATN
jgi:hypothetical protein